MFYKEEQEVENLKNDNEVMFYKVEREVKTLKNGQEQESRTFERSKGKLEINQS